MSIYYSKFDLDTFKGTPYFRACLPAGYQVGLTLQKCRAFRRLPPNLQELSRLSRGWYASHYGPVPGDQGISLYYDADGYELDPSTGRRLTDAEIDAQWGGSAPDPSLLSFVVKDIPVPAGGFPDPDAWEEPKEEPARIAAWGRSYDDPGDVPTRAKLVEDILARGVAAAAEEYGIAEDNLPAVTSNDRSGGSFFADCARDEHGRCLPGGTGEEHAVVPRKVLLRLQALARVKAAEAPVPSKEDAAKAKAKIAEMGANKYRRNLVGNTKNRADRRQKLLDEFGDGKVCPCIYCGVKLGHPGGPHNQLEQDKIRTTAEGGKYTAANVLPCCGKCNKGRGDIPFKNIIWSASPKKGAEK